MIYNETLDEIPLNDYKKMRSSCTLYIVLFAVFLVTSAVFVYFYWSFVYFYLYSEKDIVCVKFNPDTQTTIY